MIKKQGIQANGMTNFNSLFSFRGHTLRIQATMGCFISYLCQNFLASLLKWNLCLGAQSRLSPLLYNRGEICICFR